MECSCVVVVVFSSTAPATKKLVPVIRNAAPVTNKHLGIADDLIRQNATPLRKSAP